MLPHLHQWIQKIANRVPLHLWNISATGFFLLLAYIISTFLSQFTGTAQAPALLFALAVCFTSLVTSGYRYGIASSLISTFLINFFFMYPHAAFSLSFDGYPLAMLTMVSISCTICALTSRIKLQAQEAVRRQQQAKRLYEQNQILTQEKHAIELEKDREAVRSNILRAVSHDLRTPLTSISGAASVLLGSEHMQNERDRLLLHDIKDDADDLILMVENLLSITRIQGQTKTIKKQPEMFEEVIGEAVLRVRRRFPDCKIEMILCDDLLFFPMDSILIRQVTINLLENAVRHSGDTQNISVSILAKDEWAVLQVRDRGVGIRPDILTAIKNRQPIPHNEPQDAYRGMGIGLSVCQSIIHAHNGFFHAENAPDGGALFQFGLPLNPTQ